MEWSTYKCTTYCTSIYMVHITCIKVAELHEVCKYFVGSVVICVVG